MVEERFILIYCEWGLGNTGRVENVGMLGVILDLPET